MTARKPLEPSPDIIECAERPLPEILTARLQKLSRGRSILSPLKGKKWAVRDIIADPKRMVLKYSDSGVEKGSIPLHNLSVETHDCASEEKFAFRITAYSASIGGKEDSIILASNDETTRRYWMDSLENFPRMQAILAARREVSNYKDSLSTWRLAATNRLPPPPSKDPPLHKLPKSVLIPPPYPGEDDRIDDCSTVDESIESHDDDSSGRRNDTYNPEEEVIDDDGDGDERSASDEEKKLKMAKRDELFFSLKKKQDKARRRELLGAMDKSQRAEFLEKEKETKEREAKHDVRKSSHHRRSSKLYMPKTSLGVGRGGGRGNGRGGGRGGGHGGGRGIERGARHIGEVIYT